MIKMGGLRYPRSAASGFLSRWCAASVGAALLASCAAHQERRPDEVITRNFAAKGYVSAEHDAVTTGQYAWTFAGRDVNVVLSAPRRSGLAPVLVYLPGLGESSQAGEQWRTAWSSAGYAVLSVQALSEDARAWSSDLARDGDFKLLGRQRFSGKVMNDRVEMLAVVLAEAQHRAAAGESPWQGLDWDRIAIAGFDLGAYAAMAVAGEHVPDAESVAGRFPLRAAIALSPFASSVGESFDTRYSDIRAPVLSVTSASAEDVLGLVDGAYLRDVPFKHLAGPDKYLLFLQGVHHAELSGGVEAKSPKTDSDQGKRSADSAKRSGGDSSSQHRKGGRRADTGGNGNLERGRTDGGQGVTAESLSATGSELRLIATRAVSTAFLDAYVKDDPMAREWLNAGAAGWLGTTGDLRQRQ